jgi:thiol-disulfide isomerase/thioredoxin
MVKFFIPILIFFSSLSSQQQNSVIQNNYIDFELPTVSTYSIKLSDIVGKKLIILNFWASWCPYCNQEVPYLIELANKYKDKNLEIIAVNIGEHEKIVKKFVSNKQINYIVVLDTTTEVAKRYNIKGIPTNFVIDLTGKIIFVGHLLPTEEFIIKNLPKPEPVKQKKKKVYNKK